MIRVKLFVCPHQGNEVFGVGQVDDVVRPAGDHVDGFDFFAAHLERDLLVRVDIAFLDQRSAADDDEKLPLAVVPVLTLGYSGLADVDAELTAVYGF